MTAHTSPLLRIANNPPENKAQLLSLKGIGKTFVKKYGDEVIELISSAYNN